MNEPATLTCQLTGPEFAARKERIAGGLFAHAEETIELEDGFAYRFAATAPLPDTVFEFIEAERICCPFLRFEVTFEPDHGPLWLTLRGDGDVKAFIGLELGLR